MVLVAPYFVMLYIYHPHRSMATPDRTKFNNFKSIKTTAPGQVAVLATLAFRPFRNVSAKGDDLKNVLYQKVSFEVFA